MKKFGFRILVLILCMFFSVSLSAQEEDRAYNLKVKLKPKIVDSGVYWRGRKNINWQEEIKNWHFGLLPEDKIILPLIIDKEDFYPAEEDYQEKYSWDNKNNMRLFVFNPNNTKIKSTFEFSARLYKKDKTLEIRVNGKKIEQVHITYKEDEFNHFKTKNILLEPGMNKIMFLPLGETDILEVENWKKEKAARKVAVKFKKFKFSNAQVIKSKNHKKIDGDIRYVLQNGYLDLMFLSNKIVAFSKKLDVILEEFPLFNFDAEFKKNIGKKLYIYCGIDYTGDNKIDEYIQLNNIGEHHLFELAKGKWQKAAEYENDFLLKRVIVLILPEEETITEDKIEVLSLKNLSFYNRNCLVLIDREFNMNSLGFKDINIKSEIIKQQNKINIISYFDVNSVEFKKEKVVGLNKFSKKRKVEESRISIPIDKNKTGDFSYCAFNYSIEDPRLQEIRLAVLGTIDGKEEIFSIQENQYLKSAKKIELNLKKIIPQRLDPKSLVLKLKYKDDYDCSLLEDKGWYQFQLSNLKFYEKFPYPLKSSELKQKFLFLLKKINPALVKIDNKDFKLDDFSNWKSFEDLETGVLKKEIKLKKRDHKYEKLENEISNVEWTILEPVKQAENRKLKVKSEAPGIIFKKINPTKYLVNVKGAKDPFWLVFSESFHEQWKLYQLPVTNHQPPGFDEIVAEYSRLKVKEAKHLMKFTPGDMRFLFKKPLDVSHQMVNGYANGWYIEPEKLGLDDDFMFVLYFYPQSLFYLGLLVSGITLVSCTGYLMYDNKRKKKDRKKDRKMDKL